MRHKATVFVVFLSAIFLVAACSGDDETTDEANSSSVAVETPGEYQTLSIDEFADIVENQSDEYTILNVHIPYAGEIEGTDDNIPFNDLEALTSALPNKDAPIILYCRSGNMSEQASRQLVEMGYTNLYDVPGGMNAWQNSGRLLIGTD